MSILSEQNILDLIRSGQAVTQADLCRVTGLRSSTMCYMLKRLRKKGLVRAAGTRIAGCGKPATLLRFTPPGTLLALDIDGSEMVLGVLDFSGNILAKKKLELQRGSDPRRVFERCAKEARRLVERTKMRWNELQALGISINGHLALGGVLRYSSVLSWYNIPIRDLAQEQFCLPVFCTDSQHKAVTEYRYGAGRGSEVMLYFHVADGVSARPVIRGELFSSVARSGEIGHLVFRTNGPQCGCGQRGCLESLISGPAICRRIVEVSKASRSKKIAKLVRLAKQGRASSVMDEMIRLTQSGAPSCIKELLVDVIELAARGLATAIACFGPDRVIVDGYVFKGRSALITKLKNAAKMCFSPDGQALPPLLSATLGEEKKLLAIVTWVTDQLAYAGKLTG